MSDRRWLVFLPALVLAAIPCKNGTVLTSTSGVSFCYKAGTLSFDEASRFCAANGLKIASPSTRKVADAVAELGAATWFSMTCPSQRGHCNHRLSLWRWTKSSPFLTPSSHDFMPMGVSGNPLAEGSAFCSHSFNFRGARWAPKSCNEAATGALCEAPACPAGYRVDKVLGCVACASGTFQDRGDQPTCKSCAPGSMTDTHGQTTCVKCSPGRAQHLPGAKWCPQCKVGTYQADQGATSCTVCPAGTAGADTGLSECTLCASGQYADETALTACKACAAGSFATGLGSTSCAACDIHCAAGEHNPSCGVKSGGSFAGSCEPCGSASFKATAGAHSCTPHSQCAAGHHEVAAPTATSDRVCALCGEYEHKPSAGNSACEPCPLGYKSHADRKSCYAYKCSHIRCTYEEHTCRWGRPNKDLHAWVGLAFHAEPGNTCENGARYTSVRVDHGANKHCSTSTLSSRATCRCDQPFNCRDLPSEEQVCHAGHHCGLGLVSGDKTSCECMPLAAPADFPTNMPSAFCAECATFSGCQGEDVLQTSNITLASRHGKPCSARPQHCSRCETTTQREARKAAVAADDAAAKARQEKIELKLACFDKDEGSCHASRADCVWDPSAGCFATFSTTEREEADAWTRRIEANAIAREAKANAMTASASERNTKARTAAAKQREREAVLCPSRHSKSSCNAIHKCGWDPVDAKCLVVSEALKKANERGVKAHAAESAAKAREAGEKEKWNKAEEHEAKVQAEKNAKLAAKREAERLAELKVKHEVEMESKQEAATKRAAELNAKHVAELKAKAEKAAEVKSKEEKSKEEEEKRIAAAQAAKKAEEEKAGKAAAEALTKEVAEVTAKSTAEKKAKFDEQEKAEVEEKTSEASARCHCPNGVATTGLACPKGGDPGCSACNPTFHLANGDRQCDPNQCSCIHGEVATAGDCTHHGSTHCTACHPGYRMEGKDCVLAPNLR